MVRKLTIKESRRITESLDEYCVGVFKKAPGKDESGDFETDFYDELFNFNNYQDAWEEALKWNLKGYFVEIEEWKDGEEEPDIKLFKPGEMKKYMNSPIRKESKRRRMKEDWDRYDPNVEARFMDIGDSYSDFPEDYEYEEDGLYEYELAIPRRSMKEFAEFVADLFGERLEDIQNNDSEHVWVLSVDKSRDEVIVKCVCTAEEFKEIDKWAWR